MSPYTTPRAVSVRAGSRFDPAFPDPGALMMPSQNTEDNTHEFGATDALRRSRQPVCSGRSKSEDIVQLWIVQLWKE